MDKLTESIPTSNGAPLPIGYKIDWLKSEGADTRKILSGELSSGYDTRRERALRALISQGLPTPNFEDWKYTDLCSVAKRSPISAAQAQVISLSDLESVFGAKLPKARYVFVDGLFCKDLSSLGISDAEDLKLLGEKIRIQSFSSLLESKPKNNIEVDDSFLGEWFLEDQGLPGLLNMAVSRDGCIIKALSGASFAEPLAVICITTRAANTGAPKILIKADAGAEISVLEYYCDFFSDSDECKQRASTPTALGVSASHIVLGRGAKVEHTKVTNVGADYGEHLGVVSSQIGEGAELICHTITLGGRLVRNEVRPLFQGKNARCEMTGLSLLGSDEHVDNYTVIDHATPHCESKELFKGIYTDRASAAFCGTIIVREGAQKTNAYQSNQSVLLSKEATTNSKPQLKIWADDVKCTHGATVGQLDEEAMFYLRSRGVDAAAAKEMLLTALAGDVLKLIRDKQVREYVNALVGKRLMKM